MYIALMAARSVLAPLVREDVRRASVLHAIDAAIKQYQEHKSPPVGKAETPMDWDAVREISG